METKTCSTLELPLLEKPAGFVNELSVFLAMCSSLELLVRLMISSKPSGYLFRPQDPDYSCFYQHILIRAANVG